MKPTRSLPRRTFLGSLISVGTFGALAPHEFLHFFVASERPAERRDDRDAVLYLLRTVFSRIESARTVGAEYLRQIGRGSTVIESVHAEIIDRLSDSRPDGEVAGYLKLRVREDYVENRIVQLDGWLLSETEAACCALLHLIEDRET